MPDFSKVKKVAMAGTALRDPLPEHNARSGTAVPGVIGPCGPMSKSTSCRRTPLVAGWQHLERGHVIKTFQVKKTTQNQTTPLHHVFAVVSIL
ncbi:hypothetical protein J6590_091764 [Homalodisca vitripennis]|nr:hypothetical protein J6590_091764 [Homalodisca vitripennis]